MSKRNSLYRKDLIAAVWSMSFAAFGLIVAVQFDASTPILLLFAALGIVVGQILARRWFKHHPSERQEEELLGMDSVLKISVWAMACIGLGLLLAYLDDMPVAGIAASGGTMAAIVAAAFVSSMIAGRFERRDGDD